MTSIGRTPSASPSAFPMSEGRWQLDASHSAVTFAVRHLGLSKVRGRFTKFDATLVIGPLGDPPCVTATIDMSSVDTGNADRDTHLRSTDFFDVARHPTMHFASTAIVGAESDWRMEGDLTINGVTRTLVLPVSFNGLETFRDQAHAGFDVAGELKRSDVDIDFGLRPGVESLVVADTVKFELELQFVPEGS